VKAKKIELAYFGPASYSQAWLVTNGQVEPIVEDLDEKGNKGYFSVILVKTDSPYKTVADLKGKKFAFADPNSTSGHQAPRFFLTEQGFDPDTFFGSTVFSGSHENSVIALLNGTVDGCATWWNSDTFNNPLRMEGKGMIKPGQYRVIWQSPKLPSDPWAMPTWLPAEMRRDVKAALMAMPKEDPAAFKVLDSGSGPGFVEGEQVDYEPVIKMIKANQRQRKAS
jgi:phosphonate transport system substrate-binding protein